MKDAVYHLNEAFKALGLTLPEETPARFAKALREMTSGLNESADDILKTTYPAEGSGTVKFCGIEFVSLCEHHLLPIWGEAEIAYLPTDRIVGLSKVTRLLHHFAKRPTLQERVTARVADALFHGLKCQGVKVKLTASHGCMVCRGVSQRRQVVVTEAKRGTLPCSD